MRILYSKKKLDEYLGKEHNLIVCNRVKNKKS